MLLVDFLGERFMPTVYSSSLLLKIKTPTCYGSKMCMPLLEIVTPHLVTSITRATPTTKKI